MVSKIGPLKVWNTISKSSLNIGRNQSATLQYYYYYCYCSINLSSYLMDSKRVLVTAFFRDPVPAGFGGTTRGLQSFADISHFPSVPIYPPSYHGTGWKISSRRRWNITACHTARIAAPSTAIYRCLRARTAIRIARTKETL